MHCATDGRDVANVDGFDQVAVRNQDCARLVWQKHGCVQAVIKEHHCAVPGFGNVGGLCVTGEATTARCDIIPIHIGAVCGPPFAFCGGNYEPKLLTASEAG